MYHHICTSPVQDPPVGVRCNVFFVDGNPIMWDRVASVVASPCGWNAVCGYQFYFEQDPMAELFVSFSGNENHFSGNEMWLGGMDLETPQWSVIRGVLHTFGHALGLHHGWGGKTSHQPVAMRRMRSEYGDDEAERLIDAHKAITFDSPTPDTHESSIMNYLVDPRLLADLTHSRFAGHGITPHDRRLAVELHGEPPYDWNKKFMPSLWG